jgi:hypothetical protein
MTVQREQSLVRLRGVDVIEEDANPNAAICRSDHLVREQRAGVVRVDDVVLDIQRVFGAPREHRAQCERFQTVRDEPETGTAWANRNLLFPKPRQRGRRRPGICFGRCARDIQLEADTAAERRQRRGKQRRGQELRGNSCDRSLSAADGPADAFGGRFGYILPPMHISQRITLLAVALLMLALPIAHADDKREKNRETRWTENTLRCESRNAREQFCAADIRGWVRVRNQLSSAPCVIGRNWRHDSRGIYVSGGCRADFIYQTRGAASNGSGWGNGGRESIVCQSTGGKEQFCAARNDGRVRLVRTLSSAACVEGDTWKSDRTGIWVRAGCRGEFEIARLGTGGNGGNGWDSFEVLCESHSYEYSQCYTDARGRVEVSRQISRTDCVRDWTWGVMRGAIWVSEGCRAYFSIEGFRDNRPSIRGKGSAPPGILRKPPK